MVELRRSTRLRTVNYADSGIREEVDKCESQPCTMKAETGSAIGLDSGSDAQADNLPDIRSEIFSETLSETRINDPHTRGIKRGQQSGKDVCKKSTRFRTERPRFSSQDVEVGRGIIDENFADKMLVLVKEQSKNFYDSLRRPEYVEYGGLKVFKHPEDKSNLMQIHKQLKELIPVLQMDLGTDLRELLAKIEREASNTVVDEITSSQLSFLNKGNEFECDADVEKEVKLIESVAKMHAIDISDIRDILPKPEDRSRGPTMSVSSRVLYSSSLQPKKLDMSVISNKCIKKLTRERNSSIPWPSKRRKGSEDADSFSDVPLMS